MFHDKLAKTQISNMTPSLCQRKTGNHSATLGLVPHALSEPHWLWVVLACTPGGKKLQVGKPAIQPVMLKLPGSTLPKFILCIWLIFYFLHSGDSTIVVRNCALDNGGTTKDVEIGTLNHCGWVRDIKYHDTRMKGCLMTCESDGCNRAGSHLPSYPLLGCLYLLTAMFFL